MAKVGNVEQLKSSYKKQHANSFKVSPCSHKVGKTFRKKKTQCTASSKKDWDDARCSICMESPHNAVLLLCSSYNKGCRSYMCDTSSRFSNCLDQYKKAYTKLTSLFSAQDSTQVFGSVGTQEKEEVPLLCCPICRGQVKGWAVVEKARKELNKKKRSCMAEKCSFVGNYKQLKKHVKGKHPLSRPREVDPALEEKWKTLEGERERNDAISAITSEDPGAIVLGDFVIEGSPFFRSFGNIDRFSLASATESSGFNSIVFADEDIGPRHRNLYGDILPAGRLLRRHMLGRMMRRRTRRNRANLDC